MEPVGASILNPELNFFQTHVDCLCNDLLSATDEEFLSIDWVQKLLDGFMSCQEDFQVNLAKNRKMLYKYQMNMIISDLFGLTIKALDICNAARDEIEKLQRRQKHLEIVLSALDPQQRMIGEGQIRKARKALMNLALLEKKDYGAVSSRRNRTPGPHLKNRDSSHHESGHFLSSTKQLQSIANNLILPRVTDDFATKGLAMQVYTMNFVLLFVLWVLIAAIPCQDHSLDIHFTFPRKNSSRYPGINTLHSLYDRIISESKNRSNSKGLLKEICQAEKGIKHVTDLVESVQFPLTEEQKDEVRAGVKELTRLAKVFENKLGPLERQLRDVFRKIMRWRTEELELLDIIKKF